MQYATEASVPGPDPAGASRSIWFWVGWGAVAASQLLAFWLLCNHQMHLADERRSEQMVQRMALADCLQTIHGSTIASCSARMAAVVPTTVIVNPPPVNAAMPVNFNFR